MFGFLLLDEPCPLYYAEGQRRPPVNQETPTIFSSPLPWNVLKYTVDTMDEFIVFIPEIEGKKR